MDGRRQQVGTVARRNRQARWYTLVVYVLLPLVAYCAVLLAAATRRYVPPDTGDPLADAVLDVLLSEYLANPGLLEEYDMSRRNSYRFTFSGIPSGDGAGISALYAEYAHDPRYWQALALLGAYPSISQYRGESIGAYRLPIWEQALAHGATDSRLRQLKLVDDANHCIWDAYEASQIGDLKGNTLTSEEQLKVFDMPSGYTSTPAVVMQRHRQEFQQQQLKQLHIDVVYPELEEQLAELRELDGAECYPWYASCYTAYYRGEYELAKHYLIRGNAAANVLNRNWFLFDDVAELGAMGETVACGLLSRTGGFIFRMEPPYVSLAFEAVARRDAELLDALLEYAYRSEKSPYPADVTLFVSKVESINRCYTRLLPTPTSKEYVEFAALINKLKQSSATFSTQRRSLEPVDNLKRITAANAWEVLRDRLALYQSNRWQFHSYQTQVELLSASFKPQRAAIVREMEGFSYQELGWPAEDAAAGAGDAGATAAAGTEQTASEGGA